MPKRISLEGQRFGRLIVTKYAYTGNLGVAIWKVRCDCGNEKNVRAKNLRNGSTVSCGCYSKELRHKNKGEANPAWKGGRTKSNGYIYLRITTHPNANSNGNVYEHTKVMADFIGRPLLKNEIIHHKNGHRDDNRLSNLELRIREIHPAGQSIVDLIVYAKEILNKYEPDALIQPNKLR